MTNNTIAFAGVAGAHADLACRNAYPKMQTLAVNGFDNVFKAVEDDTAELGMVPIENSYAGRVAEIHNILAKTKLHIVGEYFLDIEHCLLGINGADPNNIKQVHSHPQALMQCNNNIAKAGYEPVKEANTAIAAQKIADEDDNTKAALASSLAAELYGLKILQRNFEDDPLNQTQFIVLSKKPIDPNPDEGQVITTCLFTIRNMPAALYKCLGGFASNSVNLIKLESYIPAGASKMAQFFISFEGHPSQQNVQNAMEELGFFTRKVNILGVYYAAKNRV